MGKKKRKVKDKFDFGTDFQETILQLTVTDKVNGIKALKLYDEDYFTLAHHSTIAYALKKYFKKRNRIPSETVLRENLRVFYTQNSMGNLVTDEDKKLIDKTLRKIYREPVGDSDEILEKCRNFARFVNFKDELENIDILDFNNYSKYADKLKAAQNIGAEDEDDDGEWLIKGMPDRAHNRDTDSVVFPTPFWQFNKLLNGGGVTMGSIIMFMSQAKRFKTGAMVNTAIGYLKRRKKVLYIDLENGQVAIRTRSEQSVINAVQDEVIGGQLDNKLKKLLRRYGRLKAELVIKRFPAYSTTSDFQAFVDRLKLKYGIEFDVAIVDYPDLMGATTGQLDETKRINDAYIDLKNWADHNKFEAVYTASHVTREAGKRRKTKYDQNDLAKCIDKIRHVDCALGLQENDDEMEAGVLRWEVVDQRNGMRNGSMMFWMDIAKQRLKEFNHKEAKEYKVQLEEIQREKPDKKKKKAEPVKKKSDI